MRRGSVSNRAKLFLFVSPFLKIHFSQLFHNTSPLFFRLPISTPLPLSSTLPSRIFLHIHAIPLSFPARSSHTPLYLPPHISALFTLNSNRDPSIPAASLTSPRQHQCEPGTTSERSQQGGSRTASRHSSSHLDAVARPEGKRDRVKKQANWRRREVDARQWKMRDYEPALAERRRAAKPWQLRWQYALRA